MNKNIYLHIGFHKTGTSSIQHYLSSNRSYFKKHGLLYPNSALKGSNHSVLANSLKDIYRNEATLNKYYNRINKEIRQYEGDTVISSECFMEGVNPNLVKNSLGNPGDTIKIVFYVRPQIQWSESLYGEVIKDSSRRYTGYIGGLREIRHGKLNYHVEIKKWQDVFEKNNVIVREFIKWETNNGLINDFLKAVQYNGKIPPTKTHKNEIQNRSYDPRCLEFLRRINIIAMRREMHTRLVAELGVISQTIARELGKTRFKLVTRNEVESLETVWNKNTGNPNLSILTHGSELPFNNELIDTFPINRNSLTTQEEHWIFGQLSTDIQKHLSNISLKIKKRTPEDSFLPNTQNTEEERLRAIIARMRIELNWIYA